MNIDEIRLTEDESESKESIRFTISEFIANGECPKNVYEKRIDDLTAILKERFTDEANVATEKAIKKILSIIGIATYKWGYDIHYSCQLCGGQACIDTALANDLSELLKEMVK